MKVVVVKNKKEWQSDIWKPKGTEGLPVEEDTNMLPNTYKIREVEDAP